MGWDGMGWEDGYGKWIWEALTELLELCFNCISLYVVLH
jgi:hypothetical protein